MCNVCQVVPSAVNQDLYFDFTFKRSELEGDFIALHRGKKKKKK